MKSSNQFFLVRMQKSRPNNSRNNFKIYINNKKHIIKVYFINLFSAFWYMAECLTQMIQKLKQLHPHLRINTWHFHYNNARPHSTRLMQDLFSNCKTYLVTYIFCIYINIPIFGKTQHLYANINFNRKNN